MFFKHFGGKITPQDLARYQESENWRDGKFQNLEPTDMDMGFRDIPKVLYRQVAARDGKKPQRPLPVPSFAETHFNSSEEKAQFIWYGHSVVFARVNCLNILIDPMLGPDTTPIAPFRTKRFSENTLDLIDGFPPIDLLLMTHDHYDHLDYASIRKLAPKTKRFFVALGVKRHLVRWGVAPELVTEFDWWDAKELEQIEITFTPTRHFSGRGPRDRMKGLWGGWVFKTEQESIWFSGDGGYGKHFTEIGKRLGPFDFAFMECGQYNDLWRSIHLFPDECIRAAMDAGVEKAVPVHWGGFPLSFQHTWSEPVEEFIRGAEGQGLLYSTPPLGKVFTAGAKELTPWWRDYE